MQKLFRHGDYVSKLNDKMPIVVDQLLFHCLRLSFVDTNLHVSFVNQMFDSGFMKRSKPNKKMH